MKNLKQKLIELAFEEIQKKEFGTTEQFLEIHEIEKENNISKIANIIINKNDAQIFFNVKDEDFYFIIYYDLEKIPVITGTRSEPKYEISLRAISENLSDKELMKFSKLRPIKNWNIGDVRKSGNSFYKFSSLIFKPNQEPDFFENKLNAALDFFESDKDGILKLSENSYSTLQIVTTFHNGNTLLDGIFISKENLKRISDLKLNIEFEGFAKGNFYKN